MNITLYTPFGLLLLLSRQMKMQQKMCGWTIFRTHLAEMFKENSLLDFGIWNIFPLCVDLT